MSPMRYIVGLIVVLLASVAAAQPEFLRLNNLRIDRSPGAVVVRVEVENTRPYDATDVRLRVEVIGDDSRVVLIREEALRSSIRSESKRVVSLRIALENDRDADSVNVSVVSANFKGY